MSSRSLHPDNRAVLSMNILSHYLYRHVLVLQPSKVCDFTRENLFIKGPGQFDGPKNYEYFGGLVKKYIFDSHGLLWFISTHYEL